MLEVHSMTKTTEYMIFEQDSTSQQQLGMFMLTELDEMVNGLISEKFPSGFLITFLALTMLQ